MEGNRHNVLHTSILTILLTRCPVGHAINHSQSLFIEGRMDSLNSLCIGDTTILFDYERYYHTSLDTSLLSFSRIPNVPCQILKELAGATRELRHLVNDIVDLTICRLLCQDNFIVLRASLLHGEVLCIVTNIRHLYPTANIGFERKVTVKVGYRTFLGSYYLRHSANNRATIFLGRHVNLNVYFLIAFSKSYHLNATLS